MPAEALFPGETLHQRHERCQQMHCFPGKQHMENYFLGNINFWLFVSGKYREVRFLFIPENHHDRCRKK